MEFFDDLTKYGATWAHVIKDHIKIFKLEAKLAKLSLIRFCIALIILSTLLLTTWLAALFILGYVIYLYSSNLLLTGLFVLGLNIVIAGIIIIYALIQIKQMQFQTSRRALLLLARKRVPHADTSIEKTNSTA